MKGRDLAGPLQGQLVYVYVGDESDSVLSSFSFADEALRMIAGLIGQKLQAGEDVAIAWFGPRQACESPGGMRRLSGRRHGQREPIREGPLLLGRRSHGGRRRQACQLSRESVTRLSRSPGSHSSTARCGVSVAAAQAFGW